VKGLRQSSEKLLIREAWGKESREGLYRGEGVQTLAGSGQVALFESMVRTIKKARSGTAIA
jgi:hypothetical protein